MYKRIYFLVSALIIAVSLTVMIGRLFDIATITNYATMGLKTALVLALLAVAFLLSQFKRRSENNHLLYNMASQIVVILGGISIVEYLFNCNTGMDQLFAQLKDCETMADFSSIRMSESASYCFTLLGAVLIFAQSPGRIPLIISKFFLYAVMAISSISLLSHLYRLSLHKINLLDVQTSLLLTVLSWVISRASEHLGITILFGGKGKGSSLARKIFPMLMLSIVAIGLMYAEAIRSGMLPEEFQTIYLVVFLITLCLIVAWKVARIIDEADQEKKEAEKALGIVNYSLGKIILDRTAELNQAHEQLRRYEVLFNDMEAENREIDLQALVDRLTAQNKQLENFAHITSHNLRGPVSNLNSLLYFYKYAENQNEKDSAFIKFENVTFQLTEILSELIEALKTKENSKWQLEKVSFEEILNRTNEIILSQIMETGAIITNDFSHAPEIIYKKVYMESILLNLITNALKYRSPERKPEIHIETHRINGYIELVVRDNGLGIDMKKHGEKLFGFRKTFHRNIESKGAGLFIAKAQVEALGGHITATSEVNKGTTFKIVFNQEV